MVVSETYTEEPLISVIIPAYNAEETIGAALESVAGQTILVKPEVGIEVIVVDDASTDGTRLVVKNTELTSDGRSVPLQLIPHQRNTGPAGARNAGIAVARGEWLAFLDADDVWFPKRLERQLAWLSSHPDTALVAAMTLQRQPDSELKADADDDYTATDVGLEDFVNGNWIPTSTVLVRRDAVIAAGGFDSQFRGPEDYDLWIRIAADERIVRLECPLACHRPGKDGLSDDDRTFLPEVLRVLDKAFGPGGCLNEFNKLKHVAIARQYWHASWMAFCRGARGQAIAYLLRAIVSGYRPYNRPWYTWMRLLVRYLVGSSERGGSGKV